jgi:hypothetical protein
MTTEDEARALIAELAKHQRRGVGMTGSSPDACACGERILPEPTKGWDDYSDIMDRRDRAFAAHQAQIISALLASRVSTPPNEGEVLAWAIRGRKTGRIRQVTTDEELADECREHYDVIPLVASAPATPPSEDWEYIVRDRQGAWVMDVPGDDPSWFDPDDWPEGYFMARRRRDHAEWEPVSAVPVPPTEPERCGRRIRGTRPSWAGEDQIDPCVCVRPPGHDGGCACSHDAPADAVPAPTEPEEA